MSLGLLDVFVFTDETADATGVLLLDDRPVAAGDGRCQIKVPRAGTGSKSKAPTRPAASSPSRPVSASATPPARAWWYATNWITAHSCTE